MGMGEPLINYDATVKAVHVLNDETGHRHEAPDGQHGRIRSWYRKLASEDLQITLAISLHAPTDELRRRLIPRFKSML